MLCVALNHAPGTYQVDVPIIWTLDSGFDLILTILSILGVSLLTVTFSLVLCGHLLLFCLEIMATSPAFCQA